LSDIKLSSSWVVFGSTVQGENHKKSNRPSQDAIKWFPDSDMGGENSMVVLAVADGHGAPVHFRSKKGADIAVTIAVSIIKEFLQQEITLQNIASIKRLAESKLPQIISRKWQERVKEDIKENSFNEDELGRLSSRATSRVDEDKETIPYGTTLLVVAIKDFFVLIIQIGDGDILAVSNNGDVSRPIEKDKRLISNETTSLCMTNSWDEIRVVLRVFNKPESIPSLFLVSTDGYYNSYGKENQFHAMARDYMKMINKDKDHKKLKNQLEDILSQTSKKGSGDDITLGVILNQDRIHDRSRDWYDKGILLIGKKKYGEAIEAFNESLKLDAENAQTWYKKGTSFRRLEKYNEANNCYDQAIRINSDYNDAWYNKGVCLQQERNFEKAIQCYEEAIRINPKDIDAWYNKGVCLHQERNFEKAIQCYEEAIRINPKDIDAWYKKGAALRELNRMEDADKCFEKSKALASTNDIKVRNK
jgi:tetratricopeptide (TPR) repeat protein